MKNVMAGFAGIALCDIQLNDKHLELVMQLVIVALTGWFQYRNYKLKKEEKKDDGTTE